MSDSGLNPGAEITVNARGGRQSKLDGRYDLIPGEAIIRLAKVVAAGVVNHGENNWRLISYRDHLSHAMMHIAAILADDRTDDHVGHALCRLAFAVAVEDAATEFTKVVA